MSAVGWVAIADKFNIMVGKCRFSRTTLVYERIPDPLEPLESSVQLLSDKFDDFQTRLLAQEKLTKEVTKRVEQLEKGEGASEIAQLNLDIHNLEWRSRRLNIEFHGITESDDEDLMKKVNDIGTTLELKPLCSSDITAIHRLPAKPGKTRGVIVSFAKSEIRDAWLEKRKALRDANTNMFICENLTRFSRTLLASAKCWAKESGYAFVWHANGKVLVRKKTGARAVVVRDKDDLANLK
ncbi:uncharacterized protein [Dermacentor andersoni]|uniref:uncharacterized protein n=1 Tax=Dermacentor andersoni TaxID=34620 RepID=UPI003B3B4EA7